MSHAQHNRRHLVNQRRCLVQRVACVATLIYDVRIANRKISQLRHHSAHHSETGGTGANRRATASA